MVEVSLVSKFHSEDEKINRVLSIVGHTWAPQILHRLDYYGKMRYNELKSSLKNVSSTSLSRALNALTVNNAIEREVVGINPPQVYYSLSKKGKALAKLLLDALEAEREISGPEEQEGLEALIK